MKNHNLDKLQNLINGLEEQYKFINNLSGQEIDLGKFTTISYGPYLHQNSENVSEEESAKFEAENKKVFDFLRTIENNFRDLIQ